MNFHKARYLLVGGYAVGYHGYPRATGDMDIWIAVDKDNATKVAGAVQEFGIPTDTAPTEIFMKINKVMRIGNPPVRLEIITGASGIDFEECYQRRETMEMEGVKINVISLEDLKKNKKSCGRFKDLEDLKNLP